MLKALCLQQSAFLVVKISNGQGKTLWMLCWFQFRLHSCGLVFVGASLSRKIHMLAHPPLQKTPGLYGIHPWRRVELLYHIFDTKVLNNTKKLPLL